MENNQRMIDIRKHRVWYARMVSLAYLIEHASKISSIPHDKFLIGFNQTDSDKISKIIEKRKFWRG